MKNPAIVLALALAAHLPLGAAADPAERREALSALESRDVMDRRFGAMRLGGEGAMEDSRALLKHLRDEDRIVRTLAEQALWSIWSRSGDAEVDALLAKGVREMHLGDLDGAIETFSRVIERKPDFAEGWNKRATAYFLTGDYGKSLKDCDEVLRRNPNHFGALSGYGQIYFRLEHLAKSREYFRRALELNPNLDGVRESIEAIDQLLAERRMQAI